MEALLVILIFAYFTAWASRVYVNSFLGFSIITAVIYPQIGVTGIIVYFLWKWIYKPIISYIHPVEN